MNTKCFLQHLVLQRWSLMSGGKPIYSAGQLNYLATVVHCNQAYLNLLRNLIVVHFEKRHCCWHFSNKLWNSKTTNTKHFQPKTQIAISKIV